jgi:hypothetical protein
MTSIPQDQESNALPTESPETQPISAEGTPVPENENPSPFDAAPSSTEEKPFVAENSAAPAVITTAGTATPPAEIKKPVAVEKPSGEAAKPAAAAAKTTAAAPKTTAAAKPAIAEKTPSKAAARPAAAIVEKPAPRKPESKSPAVSLYLLEILLPLLVSAVSMWVLLSYLNVWQLYPGPAPILFSVAVVAVALFLSLLLDSLLAPFRKRNRSRGAKFGSGPRARLVKLALGGAR